MSQSLGPGWWCIFMDQPESWVHLCSGEWGTKWWGNLSVGNISFCRKNEKDAGQVNVKVYTTTPKGLLNIIHMPLPKTGNTKPHLFATSSSKSQTSGWYAIFFIRSRCKTKNKLSDTMYVFPHHIHTYKTFSKWWWNRDNLLATKKPSFKTERDGKPAGSSPHRWWNPCIGTRSSLIWSQL